MMQTLPGMCRSVMSFAQRSGAARTTTTRRQKKKKTTCCFPFTPEGKQRSSTGSTPSGRAAGVSGKRSKRPSVLSFQIPAPRAHPVLPLQRLPSLSLRKARLCIRLFIHTSASCALIFHGERSIKPKRRENSFRKRRQSSCFLTTSRESPSSKA